MKKVIGPEGTDVTVWLQRGQGSHMHHEKDKAEETRAALLNLRAMQKDGVLDEVAYRSGVERHVTSRCPKKTRTDALPRPASTRTANKRRALRKGTRHSHALDGIQRPHTPRTKGWPSVRNSPSAR